MGRDSVVTIDLGHERADSVLSKTSSEKRPTSRLTGKELSADQLLHLEKARELAVISRRERQLQRISAKRDELLKFLGLSDDSNDARRLEPLLKNHVNALIATEDRLRSKLNSTVEEQNTLLTGLRNDLKKLGSVTGSVVSSVPPSRPR